MTTPRLSPLRLASRVCVDMSALVHWTWVFLAWVVLADVGQRAGRGLTTILPLVVWWVWLVARPLPMQAWPAHWRLALFPVLAMTGLAIAYQAQSLLLGCFAAAAWAQSCVYSQQISRAIGSGRPMGAWLHPLLAAALAWACLMGWTPGLGLIASCLLLSGAAVLLFATRPMHGPEVTCRMLSRRRVQGWRSPGLSGASAQAAQLAMGLMMASLNLSGDWCTQAGWPAWATVGLHLLLMALAAGLGQTLCAMDAGPGTTPKTVPELWLHLRQHLMGARAACMAAGGIALWLVPGSNGLLICMVFHCLAWGLSLSGPAAPGPTAGHVVAERWLWALFSGASLAWVSWGAASWGPLALVWAHAALSVIGAVALLSHALALAPVFKRKRATTSVTR